MLDETTMITPSSSSPSFADFHQNLSSSASTLSSPTSFSPLQHDHSYGVSTNSSSLLPSPSSPDTLTSPDLHVHNSTTASNNSSVVVTWPQINCRALRPDDYHMLLELLSSNTNADSPPIFFGSALIDPSTSTPYSDATRTQPKKRVRPGHVKRPMNAFMVFSQIERRKMVQLAPHLPNADISKSVQAIAAGRVLHLRDYSRCCGAKWKRMSLRERQPYMEESERLKHLHARQYPTYKVTNNSVWYDSMIHSLLVRSTNRENEARRIHPRVVRPILLQLRRHPHHRRLRPVSWLPYLHKHRWLPRSNRKLRPRHSHNHHRRHRLRRCRHHPRHRRRRIPTIQYHSSSPPCSIRSSPCSPATSSSSTSIISSITSRRRTPNSIRRQRQCHSIPWLSWLSSSNIGLFEITDTLTDSS